MSTVMSLQAPTVQSLVPAKVGVGSAMAEPSTGAVMTNIGAAAAPGAAPQVIRDIAANAVAVSNAIRRRCMAFSFGGWAVFERPLALRPRLAAGLPLSVPA